MTNSGDTASPRAGFLEPPQEHADLLLDLLVAARVRDVESLPVRVARTVRVTGLGERLAEHLPRRRIRLVESDRFAERGDRARRVAVREQRGAERKTQQRAVARPAELRAQPIDEIRAHAFIIARRACRRSPLYVRLR